MNMKINPLAEFLELSEEVTDALSCGRPVVALESTIITHGMPFPQNLETALLVENEVREAGGVPATIAIINGRLQVGLSKGQLENLAEQAERAAKASRRDLAVLLAGGGLAGTTVATTMQIAEAAGIGVFATGGIGGVHRGAEQSFDISADLVALGQFGVGVVCAGAKSILDIAKTLEVLETNGVPVLGYRTGDFPAFFARSSGFEVDHRLDDVMEIARVIDVQRRLRLGGVLVANPIPKEDALEAGEIETRITEAILEADRGGVTRKELTPYLLGRIFELTDGQSLVANIALIKNNARVATRIASALCELK